MRIREVNETNRQQPETQAEDKTAEERGRTDLLAAVEAILFTTGEATSVSRIADALEIEKSDCESLIEELVEKYNAPEHGIRIIRLEDSYQMCTKQDYYNDLIRLEIAPKKPSLTDTVLETLSIIEIGRAHV